MATELYELNGWLIRLQSQIDEAEFLEDFEKREGLLAAFDAVGDLTEEQVIDMAYALKNNRSAQDAIKEEERRLNRKRQSLMFQEECMKKKMMTSLKLIGKKKVSDAICCVSIRKKADELVLDVPEEEIPDIFFKIERNLKRAELKKAVKSGDTTYGHMEPAGDSLCIA